MKRKLITLSLMAIFVSALTLNAQTATAKVEKKTETSACCKEKKSECCKEKKAECCKDAKAEKKDAACCKSKPADQKAGASKK